MKKLTRLLFTFGLAILGLCVGCAANAAGFSNASLSGGYSLALTGETLGTGSFKFAQIDVIMFDGVGKLSGHGTMNDGGGICASAITGTYNVNADGFGLAMFIQTPDATSAGDWTPP